MDHHSVPPLLTSASRSRNWVRRAAVTVAAAAFVVLAFFFITVALVAGVILAAVVALRFWWVMRKVSKAQRAAGPLEGEYSVVDRDRLPR